MSMWHNPALPESNLAKFREHDRVFATIRDADLAAASLAMREHMHLVAERLRLSPGQPSPAATDA